MTQTVNLWGATYSNVPSIRVPKNAAKTEYATFTDTSDANATAADILAGKTAYVNGQKLTGTASGGGTGGITQDAQGYLVLDDEGEGGGSPTPPSPTPEPWARPSDWPDLSKMDVSGGDILYMTSYADEARGFCSFYVTCTGSYTVEVGTISGTTFTAESTQDYASNNYCELYYGSANGTYKVLRVTGTAIKKPTFRNSAALTIGDFHGYSNNQGIVDIVGKLPSGTGLSCRNQYNLVNVEIEGLALSGSCSNMFYYCSSLTSLDVSSWDTSAVTSMGDMFTYCISLTSLDVSSWDTSSVTTMASMFTYCTSLTSLDVSSWDTSSVATMASMFNNCTSLTSLDVSSWDTSSVTTMNAMFYYCSSLTSLDVSSWDTSAVTNMSSMFQYCTSLTSLDVSSWDTSSVTTMGNTFTYCYSLTSLDVSGFDTAKVTNMGSMFQYCTSLTSLDVSSWDTSSVTTMASMFSSSYSLASLDVSGFDTAKVTSTYNMFNNCYSLTSLDVSGFDTAKVTNMSSMFSGCYSLTSLDVSGFDTAKVTNMSSMFYNCYSLTSLDVSGWDTSSVTAMGSMFYYCSSLTSLDVSGWDFSGITTASNTSATFRYCYGVRSFTLPSSMSTIGTYCFDSMRSVAEYHFLATTPPALANTNAFSNMTDFGGKKIYVPSASVNAYKTAENWSTYADYIQGE